MSSRRLLVHPELLNRSATFSHPQNRWLSTYAHLWAISSHSFFLLRRGVFRFVLYFNKPILHLYWYFFSHQWILWLKISSPLSTAHSKQYFASTTVIFHSSLAVHYHRFYGADRFPFKTLIITQKLVSLQSFSLHKHHSLLRLDLFNSSFSYSSSPVVTFEHLFTFLLFYFLVQFTFSEVSISPQRFFSI